MFSLARGKVTESAARLSLAHEMIRVKSSPCTAIQCHVSAPGVELYCIILLTKLIVSKSVFRIRHAA